MTELFSLALAIQDACQKNGWPFCVIGGLAVQHWGEPRFTKDVDLTILTGFGDEAPVIEGCLALYMPRIENARDFALQNRVLLLKSIDGLGIDIALGALDFERSAVERASEIEVLDGKYLRLCTAEDLIVMKAFADRSLVCWLLNSYTKHKLAVTIGGWPVQSAFSQQARNRNAAWRR